ncbi:hypothetical protein MRBLMC3_000788 [Sphingobium sp. LMC3-1-1.1]|uniref:hypothetical protein n=1 Tax=Sphingobium sp. LMC3-1-1.1 TaxID=3135241 RepID=UPI0034256E7F
MIGADLTRYCALKAAEYQHDLEGQGDRAQRCANEASDLAYNIRFRVNAILAAEGVTLSQLEQAELA